jgi:HlyD family secretion protein
VKKKILFIIIIGLLGFLGWKLYQDQLVKEDTKVYFGNIDTRTVTLGFKFLGKIDKITKDEGEEVKKGEKLVFLDDTNLRHSLEEIHSQINAAKAQLQKLQKGFRKEEIQEAKASFQEAKASLAKANDIYTRQKNLYKTKATSEENFNNAKFAYEKTLAALKKAQAIYTLRKNGSRKEDIEIQQSNLQALLSQEKIIKQNIKDSTLLSPVNGVILTRFKEPGSIVNASEGVLEIAKSDEFWIRAYVDEKHLGEIHQNEKMLIYTDSRKQPYEGKIGFISPIAEFTPKNIQTEALRSDLVYRFRVIVQNPDKKIRQGMPVTLKPQED